MFSVLVWSGIPRGGNGEFANCRAEGTRSILTAADGVFSPARYKTHVYRFSVSDCQREKGEPEMKRYAVPRVAHCCHGSELWSWARR